MLIEPTIQNEKLFLKLRVMSNRIRFRILELTSKNEEFTLTKLGKELGLAYTKCADYVSMLEREGLITKEQRGKEKLIKSNIQIIGNKIIF